MFNALNRLLAEVQTREQGQGLVEYGLIIVLVSIASIVALRGLGLDVIAVFNNIGQVLNP
jgi:pilus assembly protein Flp/PilA